MVVVHPPLSDGFLAQDQADALTAQGLFADDPAGMSAAWIALCTRWDATVERARSLPEVSVHERVAGEWSFVETLRHMVFVTDVWVRDVILEEPSPHHPWGMPPHFVADQADTMGIHLAATPTLDEVLAVRDERRTLVRDVVAEQTTGSLSRVCGPRGGAYRVIGALQTVQFEEWAHLQYAERDLAALSAGQPSP